MSLSLVPCPYVREDLMVHDWATMPKKFDTGSRVCYNVPMMTAYTFTSEILKQLKLLEELEKVEEIEIAVVLMTLKEILHADTNTQIDGGIV